MNEIKNSTLPSNIQNTREQTLLRRRIWKKIIDKIMTPFIRLLYRSGLQQLTGGMMVVVTHVGRKTGKIRKTVLYAQHFNPQTRELKLVAAFGVTDWFLNVRANPALLIEAGPETYEPEQRIMTLEEIASLERNFRQKHPIIARIQAWLMGWPWRCSEEEFLVYASSLRGVVFWPKGAS